MAIHQWPAGERPRERLLEYGAAVLSEAELLAVILGGGVRGKSAVDVGRDVLMKFGSLSGFLGADPQTCLRELGIGPARLAKLHAALELARRHLGCVRPAGPKLGTEEIRAFLIAHMRQEAREVLGCLHLDARNRLLAFEEIHDADARGVAEQVFRHNSAAVAIGHRCPAGVTEAVNGSYRLIRAALAAIDVRVIDYVVIGDEIVSSLSDSRLH